MSREEAILHMTLRRAELEHSVGDLDEDIKAFDMAIQALSQEPICDRDCEHCTWTECPIEPCDDVISRQAVLEIAKSSKSNWIDNSVLFKRVNELPPVTQKSGKWIKVPKLEKWKCSECGTEYRFTFKEHDYCPNCGCRMVEPQESESDA